MSRDLRVLLVEDNPDDAELLLRELRRGGYDPQWEHVDDEEAFKARLSPELDIVISDYDMRGFTGLRALHLLNESGVDVPFVIVSGTIGEDVAVEVMKHGASDYLLKDRLTRLVMAVGHAMAKKRTERERRDALANLRVSEERFRQLAEHILEVFWIVDVATGGMLYISPAYETVWGRDCASLCASPDIWLESIHPDDRERMAHASAGTKRGENYDEQYRIVRPDGEVRWIHDRAFPVRDGSGAVYRVTGVARDISETKHTEETLREQASLLDEARDAIVVRDLHHRVSYWNRSAERLYGWPASEARGGHVLEMIYPDTVQFDEAMERLMRNGEWNGELRHRHRDGHDVIVEARWTLVRDDAGRPRAVLAINTDIRDKKRVEAEFLRAQRLESVGTLAGGMAHDLNNVLTPITMSIELLRSRTTDEKSLEVLASIADAAHRGAEMINQVLSFARGVEGRRMELRPADLIANVMKIAKDTFPKNIQLTSSVAADVWPVMGDPTQLHQVLLNLCVNARDALPSGGQLTIHADNRLIDAQYASMNMDASAGPHVCIEVRDNGTGIAREHLDKIFEPFYTTKEIGKGTGLGLSTSLSLVKSHGGFIVVTSEESVGTTVQVHLPSAASTRDASAAAQDCTPPRGNGETVLVVDDEPSIRQITKQTLEMHGYKAMLACDGADALAIYARHRGEIDLVLTDMMMHFMDGSTTIHILLKMNPQLAIVGVTGLTPSGDASPASVTGAKKIVKKPYTSDTLLRVIHESLHS